MASSPLAPDHDMDALPPSQALEDVPPIFHKPDDTHWSIFVQSDGMVGRPKLARSLKVSQLGRFCYVLPLSSCAEGRRDNMLGTQGGTGHSRQFPFGSRKTVYTRLGRRHEQGGLGIFMGSDVDCRRQGSKRG